MFLLAAAVVECVSLVALLVNLATVHLPVITSLGGPAHGLAYLVVVVATLRDPAASRAAKAQAFVPGIGGLLVLGGRASEDRPAAGHGSVLQRTSRRDDGPRHDSPPRV